MPFALIVEAALLVVGLCLFISGIKVGRSKSSTLVLLSLVVMTLTAVGMTIAPAPPSGTVMAGSSFGTLAVVCMLVYWFGTLRRQG